MTAAEILKMIEAVGPSDTAKLDEIDALVWYWLNDAKDNGHGQIFINRSLWAVQKAGIKSKKLFRGDGWKEAGEWFICGQYQLFTRSRDALKNIRPDGIYHMRQDGGDNFKFEIDVWMSPYLPTEELAELHAIIQAIEYERQHND